MIINQRAGTCDIFPELPVELLELFRCLILTRPMFIPNAVSPISPTLLLALVSAKISSGLVVPDTSAEIGLGLCDEVLLKKGLSTIVAKVVKLCWCLSFRSPPDVLRAGSSRREFMVVQSESESSSSGSGKRQPPTPSKSRARGVVGYIDVPGAGSLGVIEPDEDRETKLRLDFLRESGGSSFGIDGDERCLCMTTTPSSK